MRTEPLLRLSLRATVAASFSLALAACEEELHQTQFFVVNSTRSPANDLHLTIAGTGGSLEDPVVDPDGPNCNPPPGVPSIPPAGRNKVDVTWAAPCVLPQDTVGIRVKSKFRELQLVEVVWTLNGDTLRE